MATTLGGVTDAAPGWYPDPARDAPPGRLRWWDGSAWSGHVYNQAPAVAPQAAPGYAPPIWATPTPKKPLDKRIVWAAVVIVLLLFGSCGALLYSAKDEIADGINAGLLDIDKQTALGLCRDLDRDLRSSVSVGVGVPTDRATRIDRENVFLEHLLFEAEQALLDYGDLAAWSDAWREILDRREGYAGRIRALGESTEPPSLLDEGDRLDSRIARTVPGCAVPPEILDDFVG